MSQPAPRPIHRKRTGVLVRERIHADDLNAIIVNALRNADENGLYSGVDYSSYQNIKRPCSFRSVPIRKTTVTTRTTWTTCIAVRAVRQ